MLGFNKKTNKPEYKVVEDRTYEYFDTFHGEKWAKLKGEEIVIMGDAQDYMVEEVEKESGNMVFVLWIH